MIHRGTYDGTIYHNPVNRFCIISVKTADKEVPQEARSTRRYKDHLIRFVATGYELPRTDAVELELDGEWTKGKYGVQLQVEQWREIVPKTRDGVEGYLASGLIKGIGPATAAQIVSRFGVETLDILQNHPERLLEVKGITESKGISSRRNRGCIRKDIYSLRFTGCEECQKEEGTNPQQWNHAAQVIPETPGRERGGV